MKMAACLWYMFIWYILDLHHPGWQSQGVWVGNIMTPDLPLNPGCQSTPGFIIFLVGDPNLNLHLPLAYWIGGGGVGTKYVHLKLTHVLIRTNFCTCDVANARWWHQIFFMFIPYLGFRKILRTYFSEGLVKNHQGYVKRSREKNMETVPRRQAIGRIYKVRFGTGRRLMKTKRHILEEGMIRSCF